MFSHRACACWQIVFQQPVAIVQYQHEHLAQHGSSHVKNRIGSTSLMAPGVADFGTAFLFQTSPTSSACCACHVLPKIQSHLFPISIVHCHAISITPSPLNQSWVHGVRRLHYPRSAWCFRRKGRLGSWGCRLQQACSPRCRGPTLTLTTRGTRLCPQAFCPLLAPLLQHRSTAKRSHRAMHKIAFPKPAFSWGPRCWL